ncbi:hypothetical protein SARC_06838 [Sphaeroforma arctica JP610]|uniref:Uncharacterized protein n=1 Tax=Sphaeroforma arctica JP610 TaxID=667725 RepID=A0A0L0FVY8_9EUKA|nr:hypothetical protein SARC_06838 [Sphaeroforma arctica JP610]KNC80814.1 hypothetical protein SARC_06838 [Sphaeroforma arctica JP610]|eukprot:XP_014154716.1 hypothetical protein SARC_06838 [Sphaeroforma arctica JP610]
MFARLCMQIRFRPCGMTPHADRINGKRIRDTHTQFLRAGFKQLPELLDTRCCQIIFTVPAFVDQTKPHMTHDEAKAIKELPPAPTGKDEELCMLIQKSMRHRDTHRPTTQFTGDLAQLMRESATVEGSNCIHKCVARGNSGVLDLLLSYATNQKTAVNQLDDKGSRPLHIAAIANNLGQSVLDLGQSGTLVDPSTMAKLIFYGADQDLKDLRGNTVLDVLLDKYRSIGDFDRALGSPVLPKPDKELIEMFLTE